MDVTLFREVLDTLETEEDLISLTVQEQKIVTFLKENDSIIRTSDAENVLSVGERRAREILKDLVDKKVIERKGSGPATFYTLRDSALPDSAG